MKLYLSSFRLGNQPERLRQMAGTAKPAAVVLNACDGLDAAGRDLRLRQEIESLETLGFRAEELDLRQYAHERARAGALADVLSRYGLVWVRGGNVFALRRIMRISGFDGAIRPLLDERSIVYGGFSAAAAVAAPSLRGCETVDDPHDVPAGYPAEVIWEGLGLLPFAFVPHYRSDHPEADLVERFAEQLLDSHVPFVALRDGQVLTVDGDRFEILT
ncbi:Type 1 glutamine amidotransferase-like domain-containing protein [Micromonospora sp. CPCC 206060]|uniref:Type 1 glutamine amidotransferase-like domain-containing protein n=1 Tax=Micromonospora sp. CPCC 206060 TaxID=3122406 RepID=UPI002FF027DD